MFTVPVGPVKGFFYWPEAIFGNFYWPGAIGPLLASSPDCCYAFAGQLSYPHCARLLRCKCASKNKETLIIRAIQKSPASRQICITSN